MSFPPLVSPGPELSPDELRLTESFDATALLSGLLSGLLKSADVTIAFCKRAAIAQQLTNCLTEIFFQDAIARAEELDKYLAETGQPVGPLHGLPISLKDSFKVKGYDAYAQKIALAKEIGMDGIVSAFMQAAVWGTPDHILRMFEERRAVVGEFELATSFRFGGTPYDLAESGLKLYAKEVLPVLKQKTDAGQIKLKSIINTHQ